MLYETHKNYGKLFGLGAMPIAQQVGLFDTEFGIIGTVGLAVVGYGASKLGAKFPDCDSPNSRAAREMGIIPKIFKALGIKHRGHFSHDILIQTVFWLAIYMAVQTYLPEGIVTSIASTFVAFMYVGVISHLFADALTVDGVWLLFIKVRLMPTFMRKFGILSWKPFKNAFTTASSWDKMNRTFTARLVPLALVLVATSMTMTEIGIQIF